MKVAFQGSRVTSDAGLILVRELDERLGLETLSVYSRLAGYKDLNDAVRVSADPTFASSGRRRSGIAVRR